MKIYLDGKFVDEADAKVSVFDHGLLYGDGCFEGIRLYGGNVFRLEEHLERLEYSAKALLLALPLSRKELSWVVCETCRQNNLTDAYIRLVVTRGVGDLGLAPWLCPKPTVFCIASKISLYPKEHYDNGLAIVTVPTRRINPAALPPTIKSLNYVNNILGKIEAKQFGALEAIMLTRAMWPSVPRTTSSSSTRAKSSRRARRKARSRASPAAQSSISVNRLACRSARAI
jgi:branched-chain amino acid aminotransferase